MDKPRSSDSGIMIARGMVCMIPRERKVTQNIVVLTKLGLGGFISFADRSVVQLLFSECIVIV